MVATQGYGGQSAVAPTTDAEAVWGFVKGGGGLKSISFNQKDQFGQNQSLPIGSAYTGVLRANPTKQQALDFETKEPKFYKDGNPVFQLRLDLSDVMVSLGGQPWEPVQNVFPADDAEEDDGTRALYISNQMKRALQDAMTKAGVAMFGIGTRVTVRLTNMVPAKTPGYNPQKVYEIDLAEVQPYVSDAEVAQRADFQQMGVAPQVPQQAAPAVPPQQQWAQQAPADPSVGVPQQAPVAPQVATPPAPAVGQALPNTGAQLPQPVAPQVPQQAPATPQPVAPQHPAAPAGALDTAALVQLVRAVHQQGVPRAEAIANVARMNGVDPAALDAAEANTPF